nr:MAG TPA: replisome organizer [Caudoviricetes sp.]
MAEKRFFWLKLQEDFFKSKRIKKLRRIAGGDTYTIIYLKMQLLAIKNGGCLEYTGLESSFARELALDIDEDPENVAITVNFLLSCGLMETSDNAEYFLPYAVLNTGSESSSAQRVRDYRERKMLQKDNRALPCNTDVTKCNTEKEIELDKEIDREIDIYNNSQKENEQKKKFSSDDGDAPPDVSPASGTDARPKKEERVFDEDSDAYQAAAYLARQIEKNYPDVTPPTEKDKQRWAADFDKCNRINKRSWDDIADVLHFSQKNTFWRKNILSGKKFREKYDRLLIEMTEEAKKNGK